MLDDKVWGPVVEECRNLNRYWGIDRLWYVTICYGVPNRNKLKISNATSISWFRLSTGSQASSKTLLEKHYIRLPDVVFFEKPKNKTGPTNLNPAKFESMPRSGFLDFWFPVYSWLSDLNGSVCDPGLWWFTFICYLINSELSTSRASIRCVKNRLGTSGMEFCIILIWIHFCLCCSILFNFRSSSEDIEKMKGNISFLNHAQHVECSGGFS